MYRPAYAPARPPAPAGPSSSSSALRFQPNAFAPNARVAAALLPALAVVVGPADRAVLGLTLVRVWVWAWADLAGGRGVVRPSAA
jgi:hypothetical protein